MVLSVLNGGGSKTKSLGSKKGVVAKKVGPKKGGQKKERTCKPSGKFVKLRVDRGTLGCPPNKGVFNVENPKLSKKKQRGGMGGCLKNVRRTETAIVQPRSVLGSWGTGKRDKVS